MRITSPGSAMVRSKNAVTAGAVGTRRLARRRAVADPPDLAGHGVTAARPAVSGAADPELGW
jgi:hypothetical protein